MVAPITMLAVLGVSVDDDNSEALFKVTGMRERLEIERWCKVKP